MVSGTAFTDGRRLGILVAWKDHIELPKEATFITS